MTLTRNWHTFSLRPILRPVVCFWTLSLYRDACEAYLVQMVINMHFTRRCHVVGLSDVLTYNKELTLWFWLAHSILDPRVGGRPSLLLLVGHRDRI